jgi:hypothetical protein
MTDFGALLAAVGDCKVEYIVVGGAAAIAHGSARLTQDLDIFYRRTPGNLDRLVAALAIHKPYLRGGPAGLPFVWDREMLQRGLISPLSRLSAISICWVRFPEAERGRICTAVQLNCACLALRVCV